MLEGMPWPAQIGVAALGWVAFVTAVLWIVRAFIKGDIYPRSTVEQQERRNQAQEQTINELTSTVVTLEKGAKLANTLMETLNEAAGGSEVTRE